MALRFIGTVKLVIQYLGQSTNGEDRARYAVRLKTEPKSPIEKPVEWKCEIASPPGGPLAKDCKTHLAVDSSEAYDEIARTAITFATAVSKNDPDSVPSDLAYDFETHSGYARDPKTDELIVRRQREDPKVERFLPHPLLCPDAKWTDLFVKTGPHVPRAKAAHKVHRMPCGPYMNIRRLSGHGSADVVPTKTLVEKLKACMIDIEYDTLHFQAVERVDGTWLVLVSHGQIIGTRWLRIFDSKAELPNFVTEARE